MEITDQIAGIPFTAIGRESFSPIARDKTPAEIRNTLVDKIKVFISAFELIKIN